MWTGFPGVQGARPPWKIFAVICNALSLHLELKPAQSFLYFIVKHLQMLTISTFSFKWNWMGPINNTGSLIKLARFMSSFEWAQSIILNSRDVKPHKLGLEK